MIVYTFVLLPVARLQSREITCRTRESIAIETHSAFTITTESLSGSSPLCAILHERQLLVTGDDQSHIHRSQHNHAIDLSIYAARFNPHGPNQTFQPDQSLYDMSMLKTYTLLSMANLTRCRRFT